jgi:hypothetical protein
VARFELDSQRAMNIGDEFAAVNLSERATVELLDAYHEARL